MLLIFRDCPIIQISLKEDVSFNRDILNIKENKRHLLNVRTLSGISTLTDMSEQLIKIIPLAEEWDYKLCAFLLLFWLNDRLRGHAA